MANIKNLTGQRFGRLIALERTEQHKGHCFLWRCRCDCGNETLVSTYFLTHGLTRSCGCLQEEARKHNHAGKRYGRLVAIEPTGEKIHNCLIWRCICDCGKIAFVRSDHLARGITKSCGCLHDETAKINCRDGYKVNLRDGTNLARIKSDKPDAHNTSGVKGVSWHKGTGKWVARIQFKKQSISLGYYDDFDEAVAARKKAEKRYFGEYFERLEKQ